MKKLSAILISLIFIVLLGTSQTPQAQKKKIEIMTIDQIQPGMTGIGKSVFGGPEPQIPSEFNVLIHPDKAKILYGIKDKQIILAILSGGPNNIIDEAGVIAGMSGSPVYIDGKLVGAVAYRFNIFQTKPLAGITPIEDMLKLISKKNTLLPVVPPPELRVPLFISGLWSERGQRLLKEKLQNSAPWIKIMPAFGGVADGSASFPKTKLDLNDGDAISVALMIGDFNIVATGTVTLRLDNIIWAFGHPFLWSGKSNLPLFKTDIATIASSLYDSYKLQTKIYPEQLGTLFIDDLSGIVGRLERKTTTLPVNINIRINEGSDFDKQENFKVKIAQKNPYSGSLLFIGLLNSLYVSSPNLAGTLVRLKTKITYHPLQAKLMALVNTGHNFLPALPVIGLEKSRKEKALSIPQAFFLDKKPNIDLSRNIYPIIRLFKFLEKADLDIKDVSFRVELTKNLTPGNAPILRLKNISSSKYQAKPEEKLTIGITLEDNRRLYNRILVYKIPAYVGNQKFDNGYLTIKVQDFKTRLDELLAEDIRKPKNVIQVLRFLEKAKKNILYLEIKINQDIVKANYDHLKEMGIMRGKWLAEDKEQKREKFTTLEEVSLESDIPLEKIVDVMVNGFIKVTVAK